MAHKTIRLDTGQAGPDLLHRAMLLIDLRGTPLSDEEPILDGRGSKLALTPSDSLPPEIASFLAQPEKQQLDSGDAIALFYSLLLPRDKDDAQVDAGIRARATVERADQLLLIRARYAAFGREL